MPLLNYNCPSHGRFHKISTAGTKKEKCPRCRKWSPAELSHPAATVRVSVEKGERAEVLRDEELELRMAGAAEEARRINQENRQKRLEAIQELPDEEREEQAEEVEFRRKVEDVIKSEPQEDLDKEGLKVWRAEPEHAEKMQEKRGDAAEKQPDPER